MDTWYLGYCIQSPRDGKPGRIVPHSSLHKNARGHYVVDLPLEDFARDFSPNGTVFWPQIPPSPFELGGCLVRFRCGRSHNYGDPDTRKDWMVVSRSASGTSEVEGIGYRIVQEGPGSRGVGGEGTGIAIVVPPRRSRNSVTRGSARSRIA